MDTKKITKMAIFDFDGTLVDTELPESGKQIYLDKTGKEWPHIGWWGKAESLDIEIFENKLVDSVKLSYDEMKLADDTLMVMLTGRRIVLSTHVEKILEKYELEFDEYHYNTGGPTEVSKINTITELLLKFTDIDEILLWDDRLLHIPFFTEFLDKQCKIERIKKFSITIVPSNNHIDAVKPIIKKKKNKH